MRTDWIGRVGTDGSVGAGSGAGATGARIGVIGRGAGGGGSLLEFPPPPLGGAGRAPGSVRIKGRASMQFRPGVEQAVARTTVEADHAACARQEGQVRDTAEIEEFSQGTYPKRMSTAPRYTVF